MMDIDESYGLSGPTFDDEEECEWTVSEWAENERDEIADAQDWWDNMREERRISNR